VLIEINRVIQKFIVCIFAFCSLKMLLRKNMLLLGAVLSVLLCFSQVLFVEAEATM